MQSDALSWEQPQSLPRPRSAASEEGGTYAKLHD